MREGLVWLLFLIFGIGLLSLSISITKLDKDVKFLKKVAAQNNLFLRPELQKSTIGG
jgi:hypothetical protein